MNSTKNAIDYPVFLRALEGIPLLMFAVACLVFSRYIRKDPLF